jgi:hypothetical protein
MAMDPVKIIILLGLFVTFLFAENVADSAGLLLDTLPIRIAACIILIGVVSYDPFISLGVFMVIAAIYIHHHQHDLNNVLVLEDNMALKGIKSPHTMDSLNQGGSADESHDEMDFTSKEEDQDNEFHKVGNSIDEKQVLQSEGLGSKSQSLFPDDSHHADSLMNGNRNGHHE